MATHNVNLDALIEREDFESGDAIGAGGSEPSFKLQELARSQMYFRVLRKPDFQRTTDNWTPTMVVDFVQSFLDDELIPSIILWQSKQTGKVFVIDGAHRVSSLIAWVNDDYGNGLLSKDFFKGDVPAAQRKFDAITRELMESRIGSYKKLSGALHDPLGTHDEEVLRRARVIASRQPACQYVKGGPQIAEKSFLTINKNPAVIDKLELDIIQARRKPNTIATRAIMSAGKGHKYWGDFPDTEAEIERLAKETYALIFGDVVELEIHNADVPRAGQPYSSVAFKMILDFVNEFNGITSAMWQPSKMKRKAATAAPPLNDDVDGSATIECLKKVKDAAELVSGGENGSLGFDPAVYSYGATTKFHPAAFLASIKFVQKLGGENRLIAFTTVREKFEEFMVRHKYIINQLVGIKGGGMRSFDSFLAMYDAILKIFLKNANASDPEIFAEFVKNDRLKKLRPEFIPSDEEDLNLTRRKRFSKNVQQAAVLREVLENRPRCPICRARYAPDARSKDHKKDIELGGVGTLDNLQFTHSYCNNSKNGLRAIGFYKEGETSETATGV